MRRRREGARRKKKKRLSQLPTSALLTYSIPSLSISLSLSRYPLASSPSFSLWILLCSSLFFDHLSELGHRQTVRQHFEEHRREKKKKKKKRVLSMRTIQGFFNK